jgi:uncharacterized membrane protein
MGWFRRAKSENNALLPSVEQLTQISTDLGPKMAELIVQIAARNQRGELLYATLSLLGGLIVAVGVIGGFVYLVVQGYPKAAAGLLGVGVLNVIGGFVRNRVREQ